jgi:Mor family transcriptional regulator
MGQPTQIAKERNEAMYNDFKSGMSYIELVHKYQVSSQRVWQIIKREQLKDEVLPLVGNDNKN